METIHLYQGLSHQSCCQHVETLTIAGQTWCSCPPPQTLLVIQIQTLAQRRTRVYQTQPRTHSSPAGVPPLRQGRMLLLAAGLALADAVPQLHSHRLAIAQLSRRHQLYRLHLARLCAAYHIPDTSSCSTSLTATSQQCLRQSRGTQHTAS